jgi:hypothetical protein
MPSFPRAALLHAYCPLHYFPVFHLQFCVLRGALLVRRPHFLGTEDQFWWVWAPKEPCLPFCVLVLLCL